MKPQLEFVPHELNSSLHAFRYENGYFDAPWHYHKEYELTMILKGSGMRYMGNSLDDFYEGDLVLVGSMLPHCWKNDIHYAQGVSSICIQWEHPVLHWFIEGSIELQEIMTLLNNAQCGVRLFHEPKDGIKEKLEEILQLSEGKKMIAFLSLLVDLTEIAKMTLLSGVGKGLDINQQSDRRIQGILEYISKNFHRKVSIREMADLSCLTEVSFCKFFKRKFHKSFTAYVNEFRVRKSCQLLRQTDKKLMDIALSCGYGNMSFYHKQFRKYLGMTPSAYRSMHK